VRATSAWFGGDDVEITVVLSLPRIIDAVADNLQLTGNARNGTTITHFEKALDYLPGAAGRLLISVEHR
jgi:hypothetical protein